MKKAYHQKQPEDTGGQHFQHSEEENKPLRINKYLTAAGFCSRREADRLVEEGRVSIDGTPAIMGAGVLPGQQVQVDGKEVAASQSHVYIALNKPIGIACTLEQNVDGNIGNYMSFKQRIFPIGRLDKDSSGLILLTSDGDIVNKILRAENCHEKEYIVQVNRPLTPAFLEKMAAGVEITNMRTKTRERTKKCGVRQLGHRTFSLTLTQGLNRQIRRMCTELGYSVNTLQRIRIMNIHLGDLTVGQWRYLTQEELTALEKSIG